MPTSPKTKKSRAQEEHVAELIGGRTTPRSGAGWVHKNDVMSDKLLVECKRTDNEKSITVKFLDANQVEINAACIGREGMMALEMSGHHFFLVSEFVMAELLEAAEWK